MLSRVRRLENFTGLVRQAKAGQSNALTRMSCFVQQSRTIRTKSGTDFYTNAARRDERLLKRLEAQLTNVQAKIKRDEEEAERMMKRQKHHGSPASGKEAVPNHNFYFWEKVLSNSDRAELAKHNIRSLDELYSVYETAEARISRPPYPSIERLEPKFQVAHEIYKSIPHKLSAAGRAQANKPSGGWF